MASECTADEFIEEMEDKASQVSSGYELLLQQFIPLIAANVQQNFDTGSTAGGEAWPEHAPSTIRRYGPHPLLILSGALEAASVRSGGNHIEEINGLTLRFGNTGIPYAGVHQDGYGYIPQREYMAISQGTVDECCNMAADFEVQRLMEP